MDIESVSAESNSLLSYLPDTLNMSETPAPYTLLYMAQSTCNNMSKHSSVITPLSSEYWLLCIPGDANSKPCNCNSMLRCIHCKC